MAVDPVFQLHIVAGFRIGKAAAGQDGHKQIRLGYLAGNRVMDIQGYAAQSTSMASPGLCWIRMVAFVTLAHRRYFSQYLVYM